mmetsp:Transcript_92969/g.221051  ORF Transcript_92969/g.221051 Transcript_92969/m.221051 type:complete len:299 (-) Transcript_92969:28-924(-)
MGLRAETHQRLDLEVRQSICLHLHRVAHAPQALLLVFPVQAFRAHQDHIPVLGLAPVPRLEANGEDLGVEGKGPQVQAVAGQREPVAVGLFEVPVRTEPIDELVGPREIAAAGDGLVVVHRIVNDHLGVEDAHLFYLLARQANAPGVLPVQHQRKVDIKEDALDVDGGDAVHLNGHLHRPTLPVRAKGVGPPKTPQRAGGQHAAGGSCQIILARVEETASFICKPAPHVHGQRQSHKIVLLAEEIQILGGLQQLFLREALGPVQRCLGVHVELLSVLGEELADEHTGLCPAPKRRGVP